MEARHRLANMEDWVTEQGVNKISVGILLFLNLNQNIRVQWFKITGQGKKRPNRSPFT